MKVDLYLLSSAEPRQQLIFTAKLSHKIWKLGHKIFIQTTDQGQAVQLDKIMWTYSQNSFLPHSIINDDQPPPPETPILISNKLEHNKDFPVLINLDSDAPATNKSFERLVEVVSNQSDFLDQARTRYRFYQSQNYKIDTHNI